MKFGATLLQLSAPQYAPYNVNYNELKGVIKSRTLPGSPAEPIIIPGLGKGSENKWNTLEDDLYPLLHQEFDRASSFIRVKLGEIERRLTYLERQFQRPLGSQSGVSSQRPLEQSRRFQRLVHDVDGVGDDIQALIRFSGAQRTAFRKIFKKYKKWTGSSTLEQRCRVTFLSDTDALKPDLSAYLRRLSQLTSTITALTTRSTQKSADASRTRRIGSSAKDNTAPARTFKDILEHSDSSLELDVALEIVPLGRSAGRAIYWIHRDHVEEATFLIQRYMKQVHSPTLSNRILFDNLGRFMQEVNSTPIEQLEDAEGTVPSKVAMATRSNKDEAIVSLSDLSSGVRRQPRSSFIPPDDIPKLLKRGTLSDQGKEVQQYLVQHRDVKPLAIIKAQRSTFCGSNNSSEVGNWATLDTNITVSQPEAVNYETNENENVLFPHAVLEIRWEFSPVPEVARNLDSGHLVERVRGFSLEDYTIYTVCKPLNAPMPMWQPLLEKDIRKLPLAGSARESKPKSMGKQSSATSSTEGPSDNLFSTDTAKPSKATSPTATTSVTDFAETSEVSKTTSTRSTTKHKVPYNQISYRSAQRYWNEYDDGSEAEEETYAIYVTPDEPLRFPGTKAISETVSALQEHLGRGKSYIMSWLAPNSKSNLPERRSLLSSGDDMEDSSSSSEEAAPSRADRRLTGRPIGRHGSPRGVSISTSIGSRHRLTALQNAREKGLTRAYIGLIVLAYFLLAMTKVLEGVGRKKAALEVAAGIISCAVLAEGCAVLAVAILTMKRKKSLSILQKTIVSILIAGAVGWGIAVFVGVSVKSGKGRGFI